MSKQRNPVLTEEKVQDIYMKDKAFANKMKVQKIMQNLKPKCDGCGKELEPKPLNITKPKEFGEF